MGITSVSYYERREGMTKIKDMSKRERKVLDACHNGWFMSGEWSRAQLQR